MVRLQIVPCQSEMPDDGPCQPQGTRRADDKLADVVL